MIKVRIEILPVLAETLGMKAVFDQEIDKDACVRTLLYLLCSKHCLFKQMVFNPSDQEIDVAIKIFLNGSDLLPNGLDTRLNDRDNLNIMPLIAGG